MFYREFSQRIANFPTEKHVNESFHGMITSSGLEGPQNYVRRGKWTVFETFGFGSERKTRVSSTVGFTELVYLLRKELSYFNANE